MYITITSSLRPGQFQLRMVSVRFKGVKAYFIKSSSELYFSFSFDFQLDQREHKIEICAKASITGNLIYTRSYIHSVGYEISSHSDEELKENVKAMMGPILDRDLTIEDNALNAMSANFEL